MNIRNYIISASFGAALSLTPALLHEVEGTRFRPYQDIAGVWTVCNGITGADVVIGKTYTKRECEVLLYKHIQIAKNQVDKDVKVEIPDSMRAALYSFTFNVGVGAFHRSTLLKDVNRGELYQACDRLYDWVYIKDPKTKKKRVVKGLYNRRAIEHKYCVRELKE